MSHRPSCNWDGSHQREDSKLELAFLRPLLELLRVRQGDDALQAALQPLDLGAEEAFYDDLWLPRADAEGLLKRLLDSLGREAALHDTASLPWGLAACSILPLGVGPARDCIEEALARLQELQPGLAFHDLKLGALGFSVTWVPAGPQSPELIDYTQAVLTAFLRAGGAWFCRIRRLAQGPAGAQRLDVKAPGLGWAGLPFRRRAAFLHGRHVHRQPWNGNSIQRLYALVLEGGQDGIAVRAADGRWAFANQTLFKLLDLPLLPTRSQALQARLAPLLKEAAAGSGWILVAGGQLEIKVEAKNEKDGGQQQVLRLRHPDAQDLQRAALAARAELMGALIEHGEESLLIVGSDGIIRYGTPNLARLFGHDSHQLGGKGLDAVFDRDDAREALRQIQSLHGGTGVSLRLRLRHGGGGRRWVQVGIEDRRHIPEIGGILLQLRDVTQMMEFEAAVVESEDSLRRSESFYRMIIEGSSDLVLLLDSQRRVIFANRAIKVVLGREPAEVKGRDLLEHLFVEDRLQAQEALATAVQKGWAMARLRVVHADGSLRLFEAHGRYTTDPDGRAIFVIAAHDITREDALERRAAQEGRLEAIGRLAGGVAHDFNNLLTVIQGNAELSLSDAPPGGEGRLREIVDASVRAAELVQQLLTLGRKQVMQVSPLDVGALLREHEGFIRRILGSTVRLRISVPDGPLVVRAEPLSLTRALLNVAANAKDAMPHGGVLEILCSRHGVEEVEAAEHPDRPQGQYIRLDMRDSGVGMPPEVLARIFEPYFTTRGQGNGLGLSMVLGMVRQLGGFMAVESAPGRGSTFSLFLPTAAAQEPAPDPKTLAPAPTAPSGQDLCVLVVDDEGGVRRLAADALRQSGYQVLEAADGEEALTLWREARYHHHRIDLVLSDVVMPRMDGIQLMEHLQAADPEQRCLLMSGFYDAEKIVREGLSVGLTKPFSVKSLCQAVEKALAKA